VLGARRQYLAPAASRSALRTSLEVFRTQHSVRGWTANEFGV